MSDTARPFVHLHCHSHFSLLDGASPIGKLVGRAKELGMSGLALTDHGNLYGAVQFYQACRGAGINPILGYEAYVAPGSRRDKSGGTSKESSYHLTLLAQNRTGFQNLVKLASRAFLEGFYHKPRIDRELLEQYHDGLICLSGCVSGEFSRALLSGRGGHEEELARAMEVAAWFAKVFGDRYFIEIQNNGLEMQRQAMQGAVDVANRMGLPLVATSDAHYVNREDAEAQDVLLCINTGKFRTDTNRMKMEGDQFYLRPADEMYAAFPGLEEAVARSQVIADSVQIDLELGKRHFPSFALPERKTSAEYLRELCIAGLKERYADNARSVDLNPRYWQGDDLAPEVYERLDRELAVIDKLGFNDYFLIVWDFVRYAFERNIPCTARGSGVGALVCYALRLSHVCPLQFDLLFERFLDESRLEAPDIDIDFCKHRRGEVIQYVKDKYGDANVAQIGTFGTLAARAAIRDVGRTLGMPIFRVDQIVAMVPDELGISLDEALQKSDELRQTYEADHETRELIDLARKIEGLARNVGTHAAAVVIAERPIEEYVPLQHVKGKTEVITQWAMGDVEAAGLLKMDFLGLRNLTILARSIQLIKQTTGRDVDPYTFPLDDHQTYALLCRGETKGIFQLESGGIRDLLQRMKPDAFRDIIATNALYRPGPLEGGMVDQYIDVKHGRRPAEYPHSVMQEVLAETHGVMVYQEQVMRILNRLGGIQLSDAYKCIKAISKKKLPIIAKFREEFISGAQKQGLDKKKAEELFGMIEKFAGYGFNKCVVGETEIVHAETGERTTVEDLFRNRRDFVVHSLGSDWRLTKRRVTDVVWNGRKHVYRVRTAGGMLLRATGNHPVRTVAGWTLIQNLRKGDRVATVPEFTRNRTDRAARRVTTRLVRVGRCLETRTARRSPLYAITPLAGVEQCFEATTEKTWLHGDKRRGGRSDTSRKLWFANSLPRGQAHVESNIAATLVAESEVVWDRITYIEPAGIQDTYDLSVETDHNFVADGIVVHNSHSTAYALIAYMTAYLKAHYPVEFMAALLSGDIPGRNFKSKDSLVEHLEDCQRMNIEVVPPDVNKSGVDFEVADGKILFGLTAIKGCGEGAAEAIVKARQDGFFRDLFDFCERVDPQQCGRATVETLIKAGALDSLGGNRAALMAALDRAVQAGAAIAADRRSGQKGLFDEAEEEDAAQVRRPVNLPDVPEYSENERLAMEKEVLGFYISSHPLAEHEQTLETFCTHTSDQLGGLEHRTEVLVGGMLSAIKFSHTKNPRPGSAHTKYAMWDLEDKKGIVRCILWPEPFAEFGHLVKADAILAMRAAVDRRPGADEVNLIVQELIPLDELATRFTNGVTIRVCEDRHGEESLAKLREIVRGYPGNKPLKLRLDLTDGGSVLVDCPKMHVALDPELRRRVDELLGAGHFRLSGDRPMTGPPQPKFARNGARNGGGRVLAER